MIRSVILFFLAFLSINLNGQNDNDLALLNDNAVEYEKVIEEFLKEFYADGSFAYSLKTIQGEIQDSLIRYKLTDGDFNGFVMGKYKSFDVALLKTNNNATTSSLYTQKSDSSYRFLYKLEKLNSNFSMVISNQSIYLYEEGNLVHTFSFSTFRSDTVVTFSVCDVKISHYCPGVNQIKITLQSEKFNYLTCIVGTDQLEKIGVAAGDFSYYFNAPASQYPIVGVSTLVRYVSNEIQSIIHYDMFKDDLGLIEIEQYYKSKMDFEAKNAIGVGDYSLIEKDYPPNW